MARAANKNGSRPHASFEIMKDAKSAVQFSRAIVFTTTVTSGYVPYAWLNPGTVAVNVSLDDLMPDAYMKCDYLFVDDWNLVRADSRRLLGRMYREGKVTGPGEAPANQNARRVDGEIGDLVSGHHSGRERAEDIIVVNPFGLAIEDVAIAARVYAIAQERKLGIQLPF
jgi:ornithine cyclodeaminase/alanine dehydrogenase-like protein (mu-crystallin family)